MERLCNTKWNRTLTNFIHATRVYVRFQNGTVSIHLIMLKVIRTKIDPCGTPLFTIWNHQQQQYDFYQTYIWTSCQQSQWNDMKNYILLNSNQLLQESWKEVVSLRPQSNNIRVWCNFLVTALGQKLFLETNNKQTHYNYAALWVVWLSSEWLLAIIVMLLIIVFIITGSASAYYIGSTLLILLHGFNSLLWPYKCRQAGASISCSAWPAYKLKGN